MGQYFSTFIWSLNENLRNRLFYALDAIEAVFVKSVTFETKDEQVLHPISLEKFLSFKAWECEDSDSDSDSTTEKMDLFYDCRENLGSICLNGTIPRPTIVIPDSTSIVVANEMNAAATKVQKVYKSYRTRRNLADCAVVVEELWWQALDFAALRRSSVSFFNVEKHESVMSRWGRARTRAAKVGKGSSKDEKSQKLALQHWLEAIDPRHRYGHNLHFYYDTWFDSKSTQPFFYWLDVGDGKEVNIEKCPRADLQCQCIKYLGPKEREAYEVIVESGKLVYKQNGMLVNTIEGSKWIFVLSTLRALYVGKKKKGKFQHSSFLSGGATSAAGRLVAYGGVLQAIWPYSGHYLPTQENFKEFINFLQDNHVDLAEVKKYATDNDEPLSSVTSEESNESNHENIIKEEGSTNAPNKEEGSASINLTKALSCKWTSGVGPRIGCVRDYPMDLQTKALEQVNLSPRNMPSFVAKRLPIPSPRPSPQIRLSPRLTCIYGTS